MRFEGLGFRQFKFKGGFGFRESIGLQGQKGSNTSKQKLRGPKPKALIRTPKVLVPAWIREAH